MLSHCYRYFMKVKVVDLKAEKTAVNDSLMTVSKSTVAGS